jgi:hypothetical protein
MPGLIKLRLCPVNIKQGMNGAGRSHSQVPERHDAPLE